ncbi:MAG: IclR family transcriptional regulator [Anaerolineales bacterium]|nr:IclR family transcriptional regulator [Anaerolineales bacterium]
MGQRTTPYPGAQAVGRAVSVLKSFTDARPRLTLAEISRATRLNRATAYRLVAALEKEGLIMRAAGEEAYQLGPEAIVLGGRALRANDLRPASRPELEALAHATHETATLEVLAERDVLIVDEVVSPHLVAGAPSLGTRWPAHATSTGKALLAFLPLAESEAFLRRPLPGFTARTLTAPAALRAALAEIRARGWATVCDELEVGYAAAAAVILNHEGRPAAALCVGGPTQRLGPERLAEIGPLVQAAARRVSDRIGYRPPAILN